MATGESKTLEVITLRRVRYSDRHSILTVWSRQQGRVGLLISDQGSGRTASRLRALTMPVSVVECNVAGKPGSDLMTASKFMVKNPLAGIHSSPAKGMVATFVAEAVNAMLRQSAPDEGVWHFLTESLAFLDSARPADIAAFPPVFIFKLAEVMGIAPDVAEYLPGSYLNITEGRFVTAAPIDSRLLDSRDSQLIAMLGRASFASAGEAGWTRAERNRMLDLMLGYISLHLSTPVELKSATVFRSLFDASPAAPILDNGTVGVHKTDTP